MHSGGTSYHYDLVLLPETRAEEDALDLLTGGSSDEATTVVGAHVRGQGTARVVAPLVATVRTDDAYNNYVLLQPPGAPQPAPDEPRSPVRYDPGHGGD